MLILTEQSIPALLSVDEAFSTVSRTLAAYDCGDAAVFPVVRESIPDQQAVFGIKSGYDKTSGTLGLKAGGYWSRNAAEGRPNHQSSILLVNASTGQPTALISGNYLTGLRTGAASAIATAHLARSGARTLGLIGAGAQAAYQLRATAAVASIQAIIVWDPSSPNVARLSSTARELNLAFTAAESAEQAVRAADILITVTPSQSAIVMKEWVRPGTHINAMGADTVGKQELAPELVAAARVYVDSVEQAITIGECQHAFRTGLLKMTDFAGTLGGLASGRSPGRKSDHEITLFDGTGLALQDLAVAAAVVSRARTLGIGTEASW